MDLDEFLFSRGLQDILRFLSLPEVAFLAHLYGKKPYKKDTGQIFEGGFIGSIKSTLVLVP